MICTLQNPSDTGVYSAMIHYAASRGCLASLVVQPQMGTSENLRRVLYALEDCKIREATVQAWPGTELHQGKAQLINFVLNEHSKTILLEHASSLIDWVQPNLPEDLCLYREDESVLLGTIAHEEDAFLEINQDELLALSRLLGHDAFTIDNV